MSVARAQNIQFTQGNVSAGLDNNLQIPIQAFPGRGATTLPITLNYSSRVWRIGFISGITATQGGYPVKRPVTEAIFAEHSKSGWTSALDVPKVEWPKLNDVYSHTGKPCQSGFPCQSYPPAPFFRVSRVFIHLPDGSTHELRESDIPYQDTGVIDMSGNFYAVDGSRLRYDSTDIDTGTLYLPNGTRYVIDGGTTKYIDRHGNTLNYNDSTRQWRDTLGRVVGNPLPANPLAQDYNYSVPSFDGTTLTYTFRWKNLANALTPNAQGQTPALKNLSSHYLPNAYPALPSSDGNFPQLAAGDSLFSTYIDNDEGEPKTTYVVGRGQAAGQPFNPVVLAEIIYPNGMKYVFSYNVFGELDKIVYPTGAHDLYQFSAVPALGSVKEPYSTANRSITQRKLSADGTGTSYATWQFSVATNANDGTVPINTMKVWSTAPDNSESETYKHDIKASFVPFGFEDARNGCVFDEREYGFRNPDGSPGPMLRRRLTSWEMTTNSVPPRTGLAGDIAVSAHRNVRVKKGVNLILDTAAAGALAQTMTYLYDTTYQMSTGLDLTSTTESQFSEVDQGTATTAAIETISPTAGVIARTTENTFQNGVTYRDRNLLGLAASSSVKDAAGNTVARTETFYDEEAILTYGDVPHPSNPLPDWTNPGPTAPRGNATRVRRYSDVANSLYLETRFQYDQCGNACNAWNERNIQSRTEFGAENRHAYATMSRTAVPDPNGVYGSNIEFTSSTTFDFVTGLVLSTTDINGKETTYSYKDDQQQLDALIRLRKVTQANDGWTKTEYGDTVGNLFVYTETRQDSTRTSKRYQYMDALGRASRTFTHESGTTFVVSDTQYDLMGRVLRVSSPYRSTLGGAVNPANHWTTSSHDALGRVKSVAFSDTNSSWSIQTEYIGNYTIATDQALRKKRQKVDALGHVVRIDEPDALGNLDTPEAPVTNFEFDVLGNLVHVIQGSNTAQPQHRYYKFDALSRLTHERQVEQNAVFTAPDALTGNNQWSRRILYDEGNYKGLMTRMYDARNILTQYEYDNLNRIWQISYSDGTPTLISKYDQPRAGYFNKGKLTESTTLASGDIPQTSQIYDFDLMGRIVNQTQVVGPHSYNVKCAYSLGGQLTQQTYPSGRKINFGYDEASRLSNINGGQGHNFLSAITYAPHGAISSATAGNNILYSYGYNSRLQISSLQAGKNSSVVQRYEYKYGTVGADGAVDESKNNSQIGRIESWIGTQKQWQQRFDYDSIGRLKTSSEYRADNNQQSYSIKYRYDCFGNRFQYQSDNTGNNLDQSWVEAGDISVSTNRFTSGINYDAAGNIVADPRFRNLAYLYDANGRQKQASQPNGANTVKAIFDGSGQRVATRINGVLTTIMVYDAVGKLIAEYGDVPTQTAAIQYVMTDHQGSLRMLTDRSANVISRHDYQPFGAELAPSVGMRAQTPGYSAPIQARQRYAGMESDEATNMAHTLWRKYDSSSGRWTSPDPYGGSARIDDPQSFNRYSYVNNDPVNLVDPIGLMAGADESWDTAGNGFFGTDANTGAYQAGAANRREEETRHEKWLRDTMALKDFYDAFNKGDFEKCRLILKANPDVGYEQGTTGTDVTVTVVDEGGEAGGGASGGDPASEPGGEFVTGPFVVNNPMFYENKPQGDGDCAQFPQYITEEQGNPIGIAKNWREGQSVFGNKSLKTGTVIATFVDGRYPNKKSGNHVAIFLFHTVNGIYVLEQINGTVTTREIVLNRAKGHTGYFWDPKAYSTVFRAHPFRKK